MLRGCPKARLNEIADDADIMEILNSAQAFGLAQTVAVVDCEEKNEILNDLIDEHNRRVRELELPWYRRLFG